MIAVIIWISLVIFCMERIFTLLMLDPIIKSMAGYSVGNYLAEIFYTLPRLVLPIMIVNLVLQNPQVISILQLMIGGLLFGIPQSISNSLLAESSDGGNYWFKVKKSIKLNATILFPGICFLCFFGKFVLNIFNPLYAENASTTLLILTIASLPVSINNFVYSCQKCSKKSLQCGKDKMLGLLLLHCSSLFLFSKKFRHRGDSICISCSKFYLLRLLWSIR